jgi:hypothetical protein
VHATQAAKGQAVAMRVSSAKEQLLPNRLHISVCLVFLFQTSGV